MPLGEDTAATAHDLLYLNLTGSYMLAPEAIVALVKRSPNLDFLALDLQPHEDELVSAVATHVKHVRYLNLSFCENLTSVSTKALQSLRHLQWLRLHKGFGLRAESFISLCHSGALSNLTRLDVTEWYHLNNAAVEAIAAACPSLTHAIFAWCTEIDTGLMALVGCNNLQVLDLTGVKKLSNETITTLLDESALPDLEMLSLKQCNYVHDGAVLQLKASRPKLVVIDYWGQELGGNLSEDFGFFNCDIFEDVPSIFSPQISTFLNLSP
eukprot:m.249775 g.249775  ORF g.249775 m.249775 type:complete len:268 (-) comp17169_c1_seq3:6061-6864(-)